MKQLPLKIPHQNLYRKGCLAHQITQKQIYGGTLSYRKLPRPISATKPIHVTFKMNDTAYKKSGGFRKQTSEINKRLLKLSEKFQIRIYKHAVNSNHIHIIGHTKQTNDWARFLRAFSGSVGLFYKLEYEIAGGLWLGRPFSRVVTWGARI